MEIRHINFTVDTLFFIQKQQIIDDIITLQEEADMFKIIQNDSRRMIEKKNRIRVVNDIEANEFHPPPG